MLTKFLVTALVIACAWAVIRRSSGQKKAKPAAEIGQSLIRKYMLTFALGLLLVSSTGYLGWNWYDNNQVVSVTIVSPNTDDSVVYKVKKKDLSTTEIVTVEGLKIRLSNQERIIIASSEQ